MKTLLSLITLLLSFLSASAVAQTADSTIAPYLTKPQAVSATWTVTTSDNLYVDGGIGGFIFWQLADATSYKVRIQITGLPNNSKWSLWIAKVDGTQASQYSIYQNATPHDTTYTFQVPADVIFSGDQKYRFRLVTGTSFSNILVESPAFYMGKLPELTVSDVTPNPAITGETATLAWSVTGGGIPGLDNGGWTNAVKIDYIQNGSVLSNLVETPVSAGGYSFTVPFSLPGGTIPGSFQLKLSNPAGTRMPVGSVGAKTSLFSIQTPVVQTDSLKLSAKVVDFGDVPVGQMKDLEVTITNPTNTIHPIRVYLSGSDFLININSEPYSLQPGKSLPITLTLEPNSVGEKNGNLRILDDSRTPIPVQYDVALKGNGIAALLGHITPDPAELNLTGNAGDDQKITLLLKNTGSALVKGTLSLDCNGLLLESTPDVFIQAGSTQKVSMRFIPLNAGNWNGTLSVNHTGDNSPLIIPITVAVSESQGKLSINEHFEGSIPPTGWNLVNFNWASDITTVQGYNDNGIEFSANQNGGNGMIAREIVPINHFSARIRFNIPASFTSTRNTDFLILLPTVNYNDLQGNYWQYWLSILPTDPTSEGRVLVSGRKANGEVIIIGNLPFEKTEWNEIYLEVHQVNGTTLVSGYSEDLYYPSKTTPFSLSYSGMTEPINFLLLGISGNAGSSIIMDDFLMESLTPTEIDDEKKETELSDFLIVNAYPNPFNPETRLQIDLRNSSVLDIRIFDLTGRLIETVVSDKVVSAGVHQFNIHLNHNSGMYLAKIRAGNQVKVIKLILLK